MFGLGDLLLVQDKYNISLVGSANLTVHTVAEKVKEYGFDQHDEDDHITYLESSTKIVCSNQSGFAFANIAYLVLSNLSIVSCGQYNQVTSFTAAVHLVSVLHLSMDGVSIQNSTGYGLVGVSVLGYSKITRSSFIANNQYVKDILQKMTVPGLSCSNENYSYNNTVYMNNGSVQCQSVSGGNVLLQYLTIQNPPKLHLANLLFTLGVDGTFTNNPSIDCVGYGTGLAIYSDYQELFTFYADIKNTVFYRNQACLGANFNLMMVAGSYSISLENIHNMRGVAMAGGAGVHVDITVIYPGALRSFTVSDSMFECNYVHQYIWLLGSSMDILYTVSNNDQNKVLTEFHGCTFRNDAGFSSFLVNTTSFEQLAAGLSLELVVDGGVFKNIQPSTCRYSILVSAIDAFQFEQSEVRDNDVNFSFTNVNIINCNFTSSQVTGEDSKVALGGVVVFSNSSHTNNGGALCLFSTTVSVETFSQVLFQNNSAAYGGSIFIDSSSQLIFVSPSNVSFVNNVAYITGGAIYAETVPQSSQVSSPPQCFFNVLYMQSQYLDSTIGVQLYFENNYAREAGSVLYGGDIDNCVMDCSSLPPPFPSQCNGGTVFDAIFIDGGNNDYPTISSDPTSVCPCNEPCVSSTMKDFPVYPGQVIEFPFITVGQRNSTAPSAVILYTTVPTLNIISVIRTSKSCANYSVPFQLVNQILLISTQSALIQAVQNKYSFSVSITVLPCPTCFVQMNNSCVCNDLLRKHSLDCYISNQTAKTAGNQWIGNTSKGILAVFDQCPFDYCSNKGIINLTNFSSQCNYGRTDVLCGKCPPGLSTTFGTSQCKACSHYYLFLIIPFAIMGLLLVGVLFALNLTVSAGTLNGIILYANIFRINDDIFFPASQRSPFVNILSAVIAWFNLDFGIETCFFDGMESYCKTWLQFAFPLYIFTLVGMIIVMGRYSSLVSKLCRFNAVPVLATLILLSYSKILRTIITIFSYASLETEDSTDIVWLYDGNVQFLEPKHAVLFVFGLTVLTFFIVPYTTLLLIAPCLQAKSHWRCFHWINRIKPFLDCYQAPFKDKYSFWSGMLLVWRWPLYILFALKNDPTYKLWGIMLVTYVYMTVMTALSVYKNWFPLLLEILFIMNMSALVATSLLHKSWSLDFAIASAIVFLLGVCVVVVFHAFHQCKRIKCLRSRMKPSINTTQPSDYGASNVSGKDLPCGSNRDSNVEFREPLLFDGDD